MKFLVLFLLVGCTASNKSTVGLAGQSVGENCINGVMYYSLYTNSLAPAYNTDGTIKICGEKK